MNQNIIHVPSDNNFKPDPRGLGVLLFEHMKQHSNKIAQIDAATGQSQTYGEIILNSTRVAQHIQTKHIPKNGVIALFGSNSLDICIPFLAALYLQIPVSPIDITLNYKECLAVLTTLKPNLIFCEEEKIYMIETALNELSIHCEIVVFGESKIYTNYTELLVSRNCEENFKPIAVQDIFSTALILFSSGTTSYPKAICSTHYGLISKQLAFKQGHNFKMSLQFSTLYWISGVISLIVNILDGTTRILCNGFNVDITLKLIEKYKVTYSWMSPYIIQKLVKSQKLNLFDTSSVQSISIAGDSIPKDMLMKLQQGFPEAKLCNTYGMTENNGVIFNFNPVKDKKFIASKISSAGLPLPGCSYKIVDLTTNLAVGPFQKGEIRVKGLHQMKKYYNNPKATEKAWDEDGYLRTGDLGYYDDELCFYVERRLQNIIVYRQWHMIPSELETILSSHPDVQESAIIGIPNTVDREHLMGVVVLKSNDNVTEKELLKFYNDQVLDHQTLRAGIKIVEELPYTVSGKLRRFYLRNEIINK